jgi:hypothetical protein
MRDNVIPWLKRELVRGRLSFVDRFDNGIGADWVFRLDGPVNSGDPRLTAFLDGRPTLNELPFGTMDHPIPGTTFNDGEGFVGWAMSPYGIREVTLLFNNGLIRQKVNFFEDADLKRLFPFYDATTQPRFSRVYERRPPGVWEDTDVQVEVVDGKGRRVRFDDRPFHWK